MRQCATCVLLFAILVLSSTRLFSQDPAIGDWGVTVDVLRGLRAAEHVAQDARTSALSTALWGRRIIPIGTESRLDFAIQGSYNWSSGQVFANLDLARMDGLHPFILGESSVLRTRVGRFRVADPSTFVINAAVDGLSVRLEYPAVRMELTGAYTGLQLNPVSNVRMTQVDLVEENDDSATFAPPRAVGIAAIEFPELFARQSVSVAVIGQYDFRDAASTQDTLNSGYAVLGVRGPLFGGLYHDVFGIATQGVWEQGNQSESYFGYLGSVRLRLFLPEFFASRVSVQAVYSSHDDVDASSGFENRYRPISRNRLGTAVSVALENLLYGELSYSLRPFIGSDSAQAQRVQVQLAGRTYFTTSDSPAALDPRTEGSAVYPGFDPEPTGRHIGSEGVLRLNARPFSDLGLGATVGLFVPSVGDPGVFTNDRGIQFLSRLELSTRF
ncbi:MAG: hypothetical protein EA383_06300 [Spirochaetaceae bacterium]|nr:MAG: hypothetical protein EA383_06300 [Spirochaetaceae bacterium]